MEELKSKETCNAFSSSCGREMRFAPGAFAHWEARGESAAAFHAKFPAVNVARREA